MSSISGADGGNSNRKDEIIRRNREDYIEKESELVKKHNKEVRRLTQQHYEEVQNIRGQHDAKLSDIKKQQQLNQARRDKVFQSKIEDLRGLHRQQLQDIAQDRQFQVQQVRKARESDLKILDEAHRRRLVQINKQHTADIQSREETFTKDLEARRVSQQKAIEDTRTRLEARHEKEQTAVKDSLTERYDDLRTAHESYREETTKRLRDQKVKNLADRQRDSENLIATVRRERKAQEEARELMKEGFDVALDKQQSRFAREKQKQQMAQNLGIQDIKEDMQTKIRNRTFRLEQNIEDLKSDLNLQETRLKKQAKNQLDSQKQEYARSLAAAESGRSVALDELKDRQALKMKEALSEKDKDFARQNRRLLSDRATENFRNRQAFENIEGQFESRVEQINANAASRVDSILEEETEKTQRLQKLYMEARESLRDQQYKDIGELRNRYVSERQAVIENLKSQMRDRETQHAEKLNSLNRKYSKEIQTLKDEMVRSKRLTDSTHKQTVKDLQRAQNQALKAQEIRHKNQMQEVQDVHKREIAKINERHEDQLNQILKTARMS